MGFESPAKDYAEARIELAEYLVMNASSTFFMRAETDAMEDAHIPMHSLLVVDRSVVVRSGHVVVAVIDGEFTLRQYVETDASKLLVAANRKYKAYRINESDGVVFWGVVIYVVVDMKAGVGKLY